MENTTLAQIEERRVLDGVVQLLLVLLIVHIEHGEAEEVVLCVVHHRLENGTGGVKEQRCAQNRVLDDQRVKCTTQSRDGNRLIGGRKTVSVRDCVHVIALRCKANMLVEKDSLLSERHLPYKKKE